MITNPERRSLFEKLYSESKSSRDFQSTRKYQVLLLYITLLTLFVGNIETIYEFNQQLLQIIALFLCAIGYISFLMLLSLRSWHIQYTKCCRIISYALVCEEKLDDFDSINKFIKKNFNTDVVPLRKSFKESIKKTFQGIENRITIFFLTLILLPLFVFLYITGVSTIYYFVLCIIQFVICIYFMLINEKKAEQWKTWVLNFDNIK